MGGGGGGRGKGRQGPAGSAGLSHGSGGGQTSGRARRWGDAGRTLERGRESEPALLACGPTNDQLKGLGQVTRPL